MAHKVNYDLAEDVRDLLYEGFYNWEFDSETVDGYSKYVCSKSEDFNNLETYDIQKAYLQYGFELLVEKIGMFYRGLSDISENIYCEITLEELEEEYEEPYNPRVETDIDIFADFDW